MYLSFERQRSCTRVSRNYHVFLRDADNTGFDFKVAKASKACAGICKWVGAVVNYYIIMQIIKPKMLLVEEATRDAARFEATLVEAAEKLARLKARLAELHSTLENAKQELSDMEANAAYLRIKYERALRLTAEIGDEEERWQKRIDELVQLESNLLGDMCIAAGEVTYFSGLNGRTRAAVRRQILSQLAVLHVAFSADYDLTDAISYREKLIEWLGQGLPEDELCTVNGIIVFEAKRFPVLVDPQGVGTRWFKSALHVASCRITDDNAESMLEECLLTGSPILFEGIDGHDTHQIMRWLIIREVGRYEELPPPRGPLPASDPRSAGKTYIVLGSRRVPFTQEGFQVFMTSAESEPLFTPAFYNRSVLVNFNLTEVALEAALLTAVVAKDQPRLNKERQEFWYRSTETKELVDREEDKILSLLADTPGDLLDNENALDAIYNCVDRSKELEAELEA